MFEELETIRGYSWGSSGCQEIHVVDNVKSSLRGPP